MKSAYLICASGDWALGAEFAELLEQTGVRVAPRPLGSDRYAIETIAARMKEANAAIVLLSARSARSVDFRRDLHLALLYERPLTIGALEEGAEIDVIAHDPEILIGTNYADRPEQLRERLAAQQIFIGLSGAGSLIELEDGATEPALEAPFAYRAAPLIEQARALVEAEAEEAPRDFEGDALGFPKSPAAMLARWRLIEPNGSLEDFASFHEDYKDDPYFGPLALEMMAELRRKKAYRGAGTVFGWTMGTAAAASVFAFLTFGCAADGCNWTGSSADGETRRASMGASSDAATPADAAVVLAAERRRLDAAKAELSAAEARARQLEAAAARRRAAWAKERMRANAAEKAASELTARLALLETAEGKAKEERAAAAKVAGELQAAKAALVRARGDLATAAQEEAGHVARADTAEANLASAQKRIAELEAKLAQPADGGAASRAELERVRATLATARAEADAVRKTLASRDAVIERLQTERDVRRRAAEAAERRAEAATKKLEEALAAAATLKAAAEAADARASLASQVASSAADNVSSAEGKAFAAESRAAAAEKKAAAAERRASVAESQLANLRAQAEASERRARLAEEQAAALKVAADGAAAAQGAGVARLLSLLESGLRAEDVRRRQAGRRQALGGPVIGADEILRLQRCLKQTTGAPRALDGLWGAETTRVMLSLNTKQAESVAACFFD